MSTLYPKISSPFKRHTEGPQRNKLDHTRWARPEFEALADLDWYWTEKVDGTNVRVIWDGYKVEFGGRTDNAQMPAPLVSALRELFPEELLEQQFGVNPAILYGEGFGAKIQKGGGNYRPDQGFALFDVKRGDWWLLPEDVAGIAESMKLDDAPLVLRGSVHDAIEHVRGGLLSRWGSFAAEGLVGRPPMGIRARDGDRLLLKVKSVDFA